MSVIPILGVGLNDKIANNRYLEPKQAYESFYSHPPTLAGKLKIIP